MACGSQMRPGPASVSTVSTPVPRTEQVEHPCAEEQRQLGVRTFLENLKCWVNAVAIIAIIMMSYLLRNHFLNLH